MVEGLIGSAKPPTTVFFYVKPPDRGLEILRILFISEEENVVACMIRLREKENFAASKKKHKRKNFVRLLREEYNVQFMKGIFKSFAPETQELQVNFSLEYKKPRWKAKSLSVENVRYG